jgi:alanine dehydrogenase
MIIGLPKEIKAQEYRVAMVPAAVATLVKDGHKVIVEKTAGIGSGYSDAEYADAGATFVESHAEVFAKADLIIKVKEPIESEYPLLRKGQILFTYLHLAADRPQTEALIKSGCTAIAYETVVKNGKLPLLEPMSEIAGRMSAMVGALELSKNHGGRGVLIGGISGVLPANVLVIGGGTAGVNAARVAAGLGANVTILDVDVEKLRFLDAVMPKNVHTLFSCAANIEGLLPTTDIVIGAVLVPGAKTPKLVTKAMLKLMQQGSVLVDIAIDQGGCFETSHPTKHEHPTFVVDGITHYCVANMPGAYARTATQGLTNVTFGYLRKLANLGLAGAVKADPSILPGINVQNGKLTYKAVAEALNLPCSPVEL